MKISFLPNKGITSLQAGVVLSLALLLLLILFLLMGHQNSDQLITEYEKSVAKIRLVQTMKNELLASDEAEKSSVMADTDEASTAFAEQSRLASQNVEKARIAFEALVEKKGGEARRLDDFSACWEQLRAMDQEILSLAVQNTNLKALRLSFGPAALAIRHMEEALTSLMDGVSVSQADGAETIRLAAKTIVKALAIYTLEAPHIAAAADASMDSIELNMKQLDAQVRDALSHLDALVGAAGKPLLGEARNAYQEFEAVNKEVIALSRRNSNIRSFEKSLGQKRLAMAQCIDRLNALQEVVEENATFKGTR